MYLENWRVLFTRLWMERRIFWSEWRSARSQWASSSVTVSSRVSEKLPPPIAARTDNRVISYVSRNCSSPVMMQAPVNLRKTLSMVAQARIRIEIQMLPKTLLALFAWNALHCAKEYKQHALCLREHSSVLASVRLVPSHLMFFFGKCGWPKPIHFASQRKIYCLVKGGREL